MGVIGRKRGFIGLVLAGLWYFSATPGLALADGKDGNAPPAKTEAAKPGAVKGDAPAPLTERERWMLDRMEQLEKRVAELESRGSTPAAPAAVAPATQPASTASSEPVSAISAVGAAAPNANVIPVEKPVNSAAVQDKTATTTPQKAEPFAFADFTWLNGNPRTKELPIDTKFFTPEIRADVDYVYDFNHPKDRHHRRVERSLSLQ